MEDSVMRPWKRRRRRADISPTRSRLLLDERVKSQVGFVDQRLYNTLVGDDSVVEVSDIRYIAVCPWPPISQDYVTSNEWTILPVKVEQQSDKGPHIKFPARSVTSQGFLRLLKSNIFHAKSKNTFEVLVLDVKPFKLDTIFLRVDGEALRKHDDVQRKFGGGFLATRNMSQSKSKGRNQYQDWTKDADRKNPNPTDVLITQLKEAVRSSLKRLPILRTQDLLPLPLPSHPITHAPFPPLEILLLEPVAQGLLLPQTEVFIEIDHRGKSYDAGVIDEAPPHMNGIKVDNIFSEEDESATDDFYSAVENDEDDDQTDVLDKSDLSEAADEPGSSSSDDESPENVISLNSPLLPTQTSGILSSRTAATPRPFGVKVTGINSPGSVYSNYTATTSNQRGPLGRKFQLRPLIHEVPDQFLHPQPQADDDDEGRVFVDVKVLVRLGCFSGDWVKLVTSDDSNLDNSWPVGAFGDDELPESFRPVKIFGLPDVNAEELPRHLKTDLAHRQSYHSFMINSRPLPTAYVSPILFANLGEPSRVTLCSLSSQNQDNQRFSKSKIVSSSIPPIAKELTLFRVPTPIATERGISAGILAALKGYFEARRRLVREGDLLAVRIDAVMSRILSDGGAVLEVDDEIEDLLLEASSNKEGRPDSIEIAWFRIGKISGIYLDEVGIEEDSGLWGGVVTAEPLVTRMVQAGSQAGKLPPSRSNPWMYYLGAKNLSVLDRKKTRLIRTHERLAKGKVSEVQQRVQELLAAATSPLASDLQIRPLALLLYSAQRSTGKTHIIHQSCLELGLHSYPIDSYGILSEGAGGGDVKTEGYLRKKIEFAMSCGADLTIPIVRHVEALTADRMASTISDLLENLRAIVFTTTEIDRIPDTIRALFTHEIELSAPDERERENILERVVSDKGLALALDVDLAHIALRTAALVAGDLVDIVHRASRTREERLEDMAEKTQNAVVQDVLIAGGTQSRCVIKSDFDHAIDLIRKNFADAIGAPKIPNVTWDDVGGLSHVKDAVKETIQLPLERPELFSSGMKKRSGILFYGPPGTGKTLLAKAIATEYSLNFFSVKGPELLNMYIGESEANVRRVFQKARDARPCVVFFDELDSVAPKRGNQGDSGGVMDRIVSQLLAELDGMSGGEGVSGSVFVIGATNRPDLLDQALLRPGRFDKMLYLGVADTHDKQLTILEALTRKFKLEPQVSLRRVAESLPFTYTGADLYALCSDAMLKAITRKAEAIDSKIKDLPGRVTIAQFFDHHAADQDTIVMVNEDDFYAAQSGLVSSVSAKELEHYQRVRETFESSSLTDETSKRLSASGKDETAQQPPRLIRQVTARLKPNGKASTQLDAKGKDKALERGDHEVAESDEDDDDDDDDDDLAYVTSNDLGGTPQKQQQGVANGKLTHISSKGKGKAPSIGDQFEDEEDDLYD